MPCDPSAGVMPMQWRGRYHALIARSVTPSRSDGGHVRRWSGYPPRLSVNADIPARRPSAINGLTHRSKASSFAVGTRVTSRPPHRSVRAAFPHTAPTSGIDGSTPPYASQHPVSRLSGSESSTCVVGPHSPWSLPLAPPAPQRLALQRIAPVPAQKYIPGEMVHQ